MMAEDLNGDKVQWNPKGRTYRFDSDKGSKPHRAAREILYEKYPTQVILEEVSIPVRARQKFFLDFYVPLAKLAVEVHGEQHYVFNAHFHSSKANFFRSQKNDREKAEWCDLNDISLIVLDHKELDDWKNQI